MGLGLEWREGWSSLKAPHLHAWYPDWDLCTSRSWNSRLHRSVSTWPLHQSDLGVSRIPIRELQTPQVCIVRD